MQTPGSSPGDGELRSAAREAAEAAFSPYSKVRVGAALLAEGGEVFAGCNIENASFGLTLCAERAALARAVSSGARRFTAIAIWTSPKRPMMPCGACRQVLHEFAPTLRVLVESASGARIETRLDELLPSSFGPGDLAD